MAYRYIAGKISREVVVVRIQLSIRREGELVG